MQTATTQRAVKARTKAPAPFSATAAKLINQIQEEARATLLAELSQKDAITVLHGFDAATKRSYCHGASQSVSDAKGNTIRCYRRYQPPESWLDKPHMDGVFHPARWSATQVFVDASGNEWTRHIDCLICDDFGDLVQVAE